MRQRPSSGHRACRQLHEMRLCRGARWQRDGHRPGSISERGRGPRAGWQGACAGPVSLIPRYASRRSALQGPCPPQSARRQHPRHTTPAPDDGSGSAADPDRSDHPPSRLADDVPRVLPALPYSRCPGRLRPRLPFAPGRQPGLAVRGRYAGRSLARNSRSGGFWVSTRRSTARRAAAGSPGAPARPAAGPDRRRAAPPRVADDPAQSIE
jgi:hypothetical protein